MKKLTSLSLLLLLILALAVVIGCDNDDDDDNNGMTTGTLTLSFSGLEDLGDEFMYEGWIIVGGDAVSTGTFSVDGSGEMSQEEFELEETDLMDATKFILTIEPYPDGDPAPAATHYLAGDFAMDMATLTVGDEAALGYDFSTAEGTYILNTPSSESTDDYHAGIWWLVPNNPLEASLELPDLPEGWVYEGWVVVGGTPYTTGTFTDTAVEDSDGAGPTAGPMATPPFPGQDYVDPLLSLLGGAAVISIEPSPDNSEAPFALKPLLDGDIEELGIGVGQSMDNNSAGFPTGSASRQMPY